MSNVREINMENKMKRFSENRLSPGKDDGTRHYESALDLNILGGFMGTQIYEYGSNFQ